jgi:Ca-activated chloride channel homolog
MKKLMVITAAVLLVGMMLLSACSASSSTAVPTASHPAAATHPAVTQPAATTAAIPYPTYVVTQAPPATYAATVPAATYPAGSGWTHAPATSAAPFPYKTTAPANTSDGTIGLAAGGAKDIANFRENIRNGYLPLPTDVTYEGLFYEYYFDTGPSEPSTKLFSPSYSFAVTRDPLSRQSEYYMSVGLNSGLKESDFKRKTLNLVIVLDDSGSMGEDFNQYYYDGFGNRRDAWEGSGIYHPKKLDSAKEAIISILDQLEANDRFSVVLFNSGATLLQSMTPANSVNLTQIKNKVLDVNAGGSTGLTSGMDMANDQFRNLREMSSYEYENRIIILTDAEPNTGDTSLSGIMGRVQSDANNRIYTTFIGVGVDFNSQLVEQITKTRGANYYSVHSPREFKQRIDDEFDFMVTPLVFNLQLRFESQGWRIEKVFGSPEANEATGELMKINTMFPAPRNAGGEARGGLVLLKLKKTSVNARAPVFLRVAYEDRNGRTDSSAVTVYPEDKAPEYFGSSGIRKGILLTRYAALLKNWLMDERQHLGWVRSWDPCIREDTGIIIPISTASQWERQSLPLTVSEPYRNIFRTFSNYYAQESTAMQDDSLSQELKILNALSR